MLLESNDENDSAECEKGSGLGDEGYVEVCLEDLDTKQGISSEESGDELDMNEEYIFGKDKESKWRKNHIKMTN